MRKTLKSLRSHENHKLKSSSDTSDNEETFLWTVISFTAEQKCNDFLKFRYSIIFIAKQHSEIMTLTYSSVDFCSEKYILVYFPILIYFASLYFPTK